jgi:DNA-binding IclR family transcriptional regulator
MGNPFMNKQNITIQDDVSAPGTDRTLAILEYLGGYRNGRSASEIGRSLGLPLNSVGRIVDTMHRRGWLYRREDDRRYTLTNRVAELTRPQVHDKSLVVSAWDSLRKLRDELGETSQLLTMVDDKAVVLEQCESSQSIKVSGKVGFRVPMYSCAPGKAILTNLAETELDEYFSRVTLKRFTATTHSTEKKLRVNLALTRDRGYALDLAEGLEGIHCAAAVILDDFHYPVGAVTVMAPAFRLKAENLDEAGQSCLNIAREIRERLLK